MGKCEIEQTNDGDLFLSSLKIYRSKKGERDTDNRQKLQVKNAA